MMSTASHEVEYSATRGKRSSQWRSERPTRLRVDQLEDGFRLIKNISPADYTDSKFISWWIPSRVCWKLWNHTKWRCWII